MVAKIVIWDQHIGGGGSWRIGFLGLAFFIWDGKGGVGRRKRGEKKRERKRGGEITKIGTKDGMIFFY